MRIALIVLLVASTACSKMQKLEKPRPGAKSPSPGVPATKSSVPLSRKAVTGKEDPAALIAQDGTRCTVTEQRYREAAIGELVWCAWH